MSQTTESVPVSNRASTILGVSISIQLLAVIAVVLRLFARSRLAHGLGWDDLFVVLACTSTLIGTVFVDLQPGQGLGRHQSTLTLDQLETYLIYTYGSLCTYSSSTSLIKVSLLFQYLRVARKELVWFRRICMALIGLVAVWGSVFFLTTVFACTPISGYWKVLSPARCILFGNRDPSVKVKSYIAQAASNMILDMIVFALPIYIAQGANLSRRNRFGLIAVFSLGALVVVISILRLASIPRHNLGLLFPMDVTWYAPITILWSCIEVNIAVLCASIPIFWPVLLQLGLGKILVVNEVEVRSHNPTSRGSSRYAPERYEDEQELTLNLSWAEAHHKTLVSGSTL